MPSNVFGLEREDRRASANVTGRRRTTVLLFIAVLFPAIVSFGILYRQALSVPYQDDYKAILAFVVDYDHLPTLKTKVLDIAAAQHNEYKLGFEHSVVASEMEFTHHLNFAFLIALGNFFLLPIGYLLWRMYQGDEHDLDRRLLYFLPISLLFFSLTYWENLNWAMTGLQNTPVVLFSLLAIYFLTSREKTRSTRAHLVFACLAAALAAFTSANGFLLGPLGLLILLPRRAYAKSLAWCASFVVPLAAYLYHYTSSAYVMHRFFYLTRPAFFLAFLGCAIPSKWIAALVGVAILTVCSLAVRSRFDRINPTAFYFAVWLVATSCLVAWVRGASGFGIASRYSMYSILLLIFCYAFLAHYLPSRSATFNRRRFYVASVVIAAGIFSMADVSAYKKLEARRRMVLSGIEFYRAKPEVNSPMVDPEVERLFPEEKTLEQVILTKSIQEGIYTLPPPQEIR
jgi:hypothetical protein